MEEQQHQFRSRKLNFSLKKVPPKKLVWSGIFVLLAIVFVGGMYKISQSTHSSSNPAVLSDSAVLKKQDLNKTFSFPFKDETGKEVPPPIKMVIEDVQERDNIIVKGQQANAVEGRTFLILSIKIVNDHDKGLSINTRDFVRLSVNNNDKEWLAPDIHNDPVEVQAISTKYTRIGFPINKSDTNLKLQVGEINGKKEVINLNLK